MKKLVKLWKRPSYDGSKFRYYLIYIDEHGKRRQKSLGHTDTRKAERQRSQLERELRMGIVEPDSMKLGEFLEDSLMRTGIQVRESTLQEYSTAMRQLINIIGDIDFRSVKHEHGERFIQACLSDGNRSATARKKLKSLKRLFQMAVEREQLDKNPFERVRLPKVPRQPIRIFSEEECSRMIKVVGERQFGAVLRWDIFFLTALCTGMRRGELLNTTWRDIDFDKKVVHVSPKDDTEYTWKWHIKDNERRTLPLTDDLVLLLAEHQAEQLEGYPYVFVPPARYDHIQKIRRQGKWSVRKGQCPVNNFTNRFNQIRKRAGIQDGTFHDQRRTCLTNWLFNGLKEFDVMNMAGHSSFETTRNFYLAVRDDLLDRTRQASAAALQRISVANLLQVPSEPKNEKSRQTQVLDGKEVIEHAREDSNL